MAEADAPEVAKVNASLSSAPPEWRGLRPCLWPYLEMWWPLFTREQGIPALAPAWPGAIAAAAAAMSNATPRCACCRAADMWALGCLAWEVYNGELPK